RGACFRPPGAGRDRARARPRPCAQDGGRIGVTLDLDPALVAIGAPACLAFDGVTVVEDDHRLDAPFAEAGARLGAGGAALDEALQRTRALYRAIGLDPTKTRPSSEALLRRGGGGGGAPRGDTHAVPS